MKRKTPDSRGPEQLAWSLPDGQSLIAFAIALGARRPLDLEPGRAATAHSTAGAGARPRSPRGDAPRAGADQ